MRVRCEASIKIKLPYKPREQFIPFHNRKNRWATLVCHRRMGKTVAVLNDLGIGAMECQLDRPQFAYIAPNYQQAKRIAWEYLKQYLAPIIKQSSESELKVTLLNGAIIHLLGAEKADSLRGMYLDGCALDEVAQIRPSAISQVILPALSDRNGWMVLMGTPKGKNHFYDFAKKAQNDPTWFYMMAKASETGIIPAAELELMRSQMDESDYLQEFECSFEAALKGAIYGLEMERAHNEGRIKEYPLDPNLPVDVITDLGYTDDTVLGFFQMHRNRVLIHEIYANNEVDWDHYLDEMDARNVRDVYLPHDAKAKNLQTGRSIVEQTIRRGYRPRIVPDHKLRDGIAATRKLLPYTHWNYPLCSNGIEAMKSYRREWDEKTSSYRDRPVHDWASHYADMVRYLGVIFTSLAPSESRLILPDHIQRERAQNPSTYAYSLEDLFTDSRTNPGLYREH